MGVRGMSGIDEQYRTELKVRIFFRMEDLVKVLRDGDFQKGDFLFIDENNDTIEYMTTLENVKTLARNEHIMISHSMTYLEELVGMIRRMGVQKFFEDWLS